MNCSMLKVAAPLALTLGGAMLSGCQFYARSPQDYRDATAKVLATKKDEIRSCYDAAYKANSSAAGTVQVQFKVQPDTGKFTDVKVVGGTAPDAVKQCVVNSLGGLVLAPPDKREGNATFVWVFKAPKPAA